MRVKPRAKATYVPDKQFGMSILHVRDARVPQQHHDPVLVRALLEVGPRVLGEHLVPLQEPVVALTVGEPGATHTDVLYQPEVGHLVTDLRQYTTRDENGRLSTKRAIVARTIFTYIEDLAV